MEHPEAGTASSPAWVLSHLRSACPSGHPEPLAHCQARRGDEGARNLHRGGRNDQERCSLSPEGSGAKAFGGNVRDACFSKRF
jgi:hypothetical protein